MPEFNELTYGASILRCFPRALGLGDSSGVVRVSETIHPTFDAWGLPEFAYLRSERLLGVRAFQAAVAAEQSMIAVSNMSTSKTILVIERVGVQFVAGTVILNGNVSENTLSGTLTLVAALQPRDMRINGPRGIGNPAGVARYWVGSDAAAIGTTIDQITFTATESRVFEVGLPVILIPGSGLVVIGTVVNTGMAAWFAVRERDALPGELPA